MGDDGVDYLRDDKCEQRQAKNCLRGCFDSRDG